MISESVPLSLSSSLSIISITGSAKSLGIGATTGRGDRGAGPTSTVGACTEATSLGTYLSAGVPKRGRLGLGGG